MSKESTYVIFGADGSQKGTFHRVYKIEPSSTSPNLVYVFGQEELLGVVNLAPGEVIAQTYPNSDAKL